MTPQQWPDAPTPTAQETAAPYAWTRRRFIEDDRGTPIGMDEPEFSWGAEPPEESGWFPLFAAPPADTAMTALKEPLSDEQIEPLFRQINDMRVVGEKDEWFWFAWGVEMGERAHGIRSSGARHSAGTDRPGSDEKDVDYWIRQFTAARSAELELRRESESDAALFRASLDAIGALVLWVCAVPKDTILPEMPVYDDDAMAKTIAKLRERLKDSQ
jgi:hypothetical protein